MEKIIRTIFGALSQLTAQYRASFKSSDRIGKAMLVSVPLLVTCCLCAVPIVVLAPDSTPTPEVPTLANFAVVDEEPASTPRTEPTDELISSPEPTTTKTPTPTSTPTNTPTNKPTPTTVVEGGEAAMVIGVIDGDTIEVEIDGQIYPLRYIGIDTPERGEAFAIESTAENEKLVTGKNVLLVKDVSETDRFGRLLRYVYLEDGTLVNAELVKSGYAEAVAYPPDIANEELFGSLQEEAQDSSLGLWSTTAFLVPTSIPQPTNTSIPVPSDTPLPLPTNTQAPIPTNTIAPLPTDTLAPLPTDTSLPQPTQPPVQPADVKITHIYFDGQVPRVESDEYAEISNRGGSIVNLAGWHLNAGDPGQDFWFPAFDLQPGQSCRVYTNEIHPDTCGFSYGSGQALWNNSDHDCGHLYDASGAEVSVNCY